jgi:uncharacterized membrane protein YfcA
MPWFAKMEERANLNDALTWIGLVLLGAGAGAYGTMIGAGGGFVLLPLLLLIYPDEPPEQLTSISLAAVFVSAASGSVAYIRQRRVDFLAANAFAAATVPGAVIGALVTGLLPRQLFDIALAALVIGVAALLILRPATPVAVRSGRRGETLRMLTDAQGDTYVYSYNLCNGVAMSLAIGFVAALLGIGGGLVQVPSMVFFLHFPAYIATATSQYIVVFTSLAGIVVHALGGEYAGNVDRTVAIAVGMLIGGQIGARLSLRLRAPVIMRLLGLALVLVGGRVVVSALL